MFVQELCGSWMDHPFWKSRLLDSEKDLQRLQGSAIRELWIDTEKGLDVPGGERRAGGSQHRGVPAGGRA